MHLIIECIEKYLILNKIKVVFLWSSDHSLLAQHIYNYSLKNERTASDSNLEIRGRERKSAESEDRLSESQTRDLSESYLSEIRVD